MARMKFKRETLVKNIESVLIRARQEDLPATIKEVYAFGGILRDKERVHDFDAVFLYEQTPEQEGRWEKFRRNFNNAVDENREISRKDLYDLLESYYRHEIPLHEVVMIESVSKILKDHGIEPKWAACFSWTDFYFSFLGIFFPEIDKVLRKLLLKGIRGIQAIFRRYKDFKEGHTMLVAENFQLAWSPEKPDIRKNLEMSREAKAGFMASELDLFQKQLIPLKEGFIKLQTELNSIASNNKLEFSFEKLNSKHIDISFDEKEQLEDLLIKCEQARKELRRYREEILVLRILKGSVEDFLERKSDPFCQRSLDYTVRELVTFWTILRTPKYEAKEERIREVLDDLGLPEDYVVTFRRYGIPTDYELEPNEGKRRELLRLAEEEENKNKYLRPLNRIAKRFDKNFYIHLDLTEGEPPLLDIRYHRWFLDENEDMKNAIFSKLQKGAFKVSQNERSISASKIISIGRNKTVKQLEEIVKKTLEEY